MKKYIILIIAVLVLLVGGFAYYKASTPKILIPDDVIAVGELLKNPIYDKDVSIYGKVEYLGQLDCPCFYLSSDGKTVQVLTASHGLDSNGELITSKGVGLPEIKNGDTIVVTGHLYARTDNSIPSKFVPTKVIKL